jgi:hypothetical protein
MCPATLALVGTAASAGGSILGGISAGNSAAYSAQVARNNAQIEAQNQTRAAAATSANVEQAGLKARERDAGVRVAAAANGVDVNTGSAGDVAESQRRLGALDVSNVAERGAEATYGYGTQAVSDTAQAQLDQSQVIPDYLGGVLKGGGSLLSGSANLPGNMAWMSYGSSPGAISDPGSAPFSAAASGGYGADILDG